MTTLATRGASLSRLAALLFSLLICVLLTPFGTWVAQAIAESMPVPVITGDPLSDSVGATAAEFRVDESGAATYSIPIYTVPGRGGVAPKLALSYSSQGGYGPLGKGWSISGLSSITRCRATREAGDFNVGGVPTDGTPRPVNFSASDRYCLDGQRLVPAQTGNAGCGAITGMTVANLRTEVDTFQRVCAYTPTGGTTGPAFFTVDRKDGSSSWYGDRDNDTSSNRPDGYFNSTAPGKEGFALSWAQTRFQDSTGNYIDFVYLENPAGAGTGEHLISKVRYTGKTVLPGQGGTASAPFAEIQFNYAARAQAAWGSGYQSGGSMLQSRRLASIASEASYGAQARFYQLNYGTSPSASGLEILHSLEECRDSSREICLAPTVFTWSQARHEFATAERPGRVPTGSLSKFEGFKLGDVDGDGRRDIVYLKDGASGEGCPTENVLVLFGDFQGGYGTPTFVQGAAGNCTPAEIDSRGTGAWHLIDYNGDGRDDLFVSSGAGQGWRVYASTGRSGRVFDDSNNLIASLSPIIPSQDGPDDQVQLADLNGDSLTDIVYPRSGALRARLMQRTSGGFGWGAERTVSIDESTFPPLDPTRCNTSDYDCSRSLAQMPTSKTGFSQLADFNGDAASDLLIGVTQRILYVGQCLTATSTSTSRREAKRIAGNDRSTRMPSYLTQQQRQALGVGENGVMLPPDDGGWCERSFIGTNLHGLIVRSISSSTVTLGYYASYSGMPEQIQLADANGDGLTEVFNRGLGNWSYEPNTGTGTLARIEVPFEGFLDQVQFVDVSGDGRADALHVFNAGPYKAYNVRFALPGGGYGTETWLPGVPGTNGNALICEGYGCDNTRKVPMFADFDGDGGVDFMSLKLDDDADLFVSRAGLRNKPKDVITQFTNGLGARTEVTYATMTNAAVYRPDVSSRVESDWGRGSPVQDVMAASYLVARVSSSAPTYESPNAMSTVHYRYTGAKVQAGGRGYLGFREISTIDTNHDTGYVVTTTSYHQDFPFVGMPDWTRKSAVTGAYAVPACLSDAIGNACFAPPQQGFPSLGGSWFSYSDQIWESDSEIGGTTVTPFAAGVQAPLNVRTASTEEKLRDPFTGAQTSRVLTLFDYGAFGNAVNTQVETFTGASTTPMAILITNNVYGVDSYTHWRLGRLTRSTVTHRRSGVADVVRVSSFDYSMGGPVTGLLVAEVAQPEGDASQALRKEYGYDVYGNRVLTETCAAPATSCTSNVAFHPSSPLAVQRYSKVGYDGQGRYPDATYEPFWNGAGMVELATQTVWSRDMFGNVLSATDANGMQTQAITGAMGRPYYTWARTDPSSTAGDPAGGVESWTTYRWCGSGTGQVACPAGARYRQEAMAEGAPTTWTYFDVLARPVMTATQSFNAGVGGKDISAVCTQYEAQGKPVRVSNPFFLPSGTSGAGGPVSIGSACGLASIKWTTTVHDVLGRPIGVSAPDGTDVTTQYSGLQTRITDQLLRTTIQTRNGKGELASVVDANGMGLGYSYNADGSLRYNWRDAGRGQVRNYFYYDALGRKIKQADPDSGTTFFEYNALGEVVAQQDALGNRIENEYDARGRVWRKTVLAADGTIESQSNFEFDTAPGGIGKPDRESITGTYVGWRGQAGTALSFARTYSYDLLGRPEGTSTVIDGTAYPSAVQYDALGRPWKAQDATGRWVKTQFTARGHVLAVCNSNATDALAACPLSANTYLRSFETDAWGNVIRERRGNSVLMDVKRNYEAETGRIFTICAGDSTCSLMDEGYVWDGAGNLYSHLKDDRYLEQFKYDALNRLTEGKLVMQDGVTVNKIAQRFEYDDFGNICYKVTQEATLAYAYSGRSGCGLGGTNSMQGSGGTGSLGPHQVSAAGGAFYYYDARGNQTLRDLAGTASDRSVDYSIDDKAYEVDIGSPTAPTYRSRFWYGPDGQRYKAQHDGSTTLYLGNVEVAKNGGVTTYKRTVAGVMLQTVTGTTATNHYLFHDHLGSLVRVTDAAGVAIHAMDYFAFGDRRSPDDPMLSGGGGVPSLTHRGFTGHELFGRLGILHMNGRIFDYETGRFMQADPVIQAPDNAQSWNAYTYVFNNPLAYTDPTGLWGEREQGYLRMVVAIVISIWTAGAASPYLSAAGAAANSTGIAIMMAGGFAAGMVASNGSLRAGVAGAFGAMLTSGIGVALDGWQQWTAQAVSGGIVESLQGGRFGDGMLAAGLTTAFMPQLSGVRSDVARTALGAIIGGSISEVTGGKFANGAISGAIQAAMAGDVNKSETMQAAQSGSSEQLLVAYASEVIWQGKDPFGYPVPFSNADDALFAGGAAIRNSPNSGVWEYMGVVFPLNGGFVATRPVTSFNMTGVSLGVPNWLMPSGSAHTYFHNHPDLGVSSNFFSPQDVSLSEATRVRSVIFAPNGPRVYYPNSMEPQTVRIGGRAVSGASPGVSLCVFTACPP